MSWDDWNAIEAAQQKADADDAQRRADREARKAGRPTDATPAPVADPEAIAAVQEAERLAWRHPIPPTTPWGTQPTNPDGTRREGYWDGNAWVDGSRKREFDLRAAVRAMAKAMADAIDERKP